MIERTDSMQDLTPSRDYQASLLPYPPQRIKELDLPEALAAQWYSVRLPLQSQYCVFGENPITFYPAPQKKAYALIPDLYLEIAEMESVGNIAVSITDGSVWQIFPRSYRRSFMNSSLAQYTDSLGAWLRFYPQFQDNVAAIYEQDPAFTLFEHPEIYTPIRRKLAEIDARAMESDEHYWARCCEPDLI